MSNSFPAIFLFGAGRVGMNLLRHFAQLSIPVEAVIEPDVSRHALIRSLHPASAIHADISSLSRLSVGTCVLTVPDGEIERTAASLNDLLSAPENLTVFHCSGTLGSALLTPLARRGCRTGCIHPMQSFADDKLPDGALQGIGCGIEGDTAFWEYGLGFAEMLGWQPLRIDEGRKALYHVANVLAGNFPTVLAVLAEAMLRDAAVESENARLSLLLPMMRTVLDRLNDTPAAEALTGPAARGDHAAILRHLDALEFHDPQLHAVYDALTRAALDLRDR